MALPQPAVARITRISESLKEKHSFNGEFRVISGAARPGEKLVDVPGVVFRRRSNFRTFEVLKIGQTLCVNDVVRTGPDTFATIEFYTGGQIGMQKGSTLRISGPNRVTDPQAERELETTWGQVERSFGWGRYHMSTQKEPLQIKTSSGVMGIKG